MTSLQLGLIVAGIVLVLAVVFYNWWQMRRVRGRVAGGDAREHSAHTDSDPAPARVEPTLRTRDAGHEPMLTRAGSVTPTAGRVAIDDIDNAEGFELPVQVRARTPIVSQGAAATETAAEEPATEAAVASPNAAPERVVHADAHGAQPDPDIECIVALQPVKPVAASALASGLLARLGKRLRWFGRRGVSMPWQLLKADTAGEFSDIVACLLLADRTGAASVPMLEAFLHLLNEVAPTLPATFVAPDVRREAERAEALDRICAELDVQIGLTVLKTPPATIPGTRLRGVAEAAGFRLAGGRFEWVHEETGAVLYTLQNFRADPFTVDSLRTTSTPGVVFLLDVPRVSDPARVFDQMKLAAKRFAQTLDAGLVDDNRRALDDGALASIRSHIQKTAADLKAANIEPGSARALALFGG